MLRFFAAVLLSGMAIAQSSSAGANSQHVPATQSKPAAPAMPDTSALPPAPKGKSTVIGGAIREVDPVRDQLTLKVYGARPMKILYDERTQVYRDGKKIPLRDLQAEPHASIQTVLDGTDIYALSIHILSQAPEGESQGQVLNYNPATGELVLSAALSRQPLQLHVPPSTPVVRQGQAGSSANSASAALSNLVQGTLVSVKFASGNDGRGTVSHIAILATPGSSSIFRGEITFVDLHTKLLALVDPRDDKNYKISFDPARFPVSHDLHRGTPVVVTATFDGTRYVADSIEITQTAKPMAK